MSSLRGVFEVNLGDYHSGSCHFCAAVQGAAIVNFVRVAFVSILAISIPGHVIFARRCKGQLSLIFVRAVLGSSW